MSRRWRPGCSRKRASRSWEAAKWWRGKTSAVAARTLYGSRKRSACSSCSGISSGARRAAFASPGSIRTTRGRATASRLRGSSGSRSPPVRKDMAIAEPTALVDIASAISEFASDGGNAAVLLEGLEYLISQNGFPSVMRFLQKVNEKIVINDSYLLISANPAAMKEQEYTVLAKEVAGEV